MSKRNPRNSSGNGGGNPSLGPDDVLLERLRRHLAFLGLTHTLVALDELLAWASRERPGHSAWLEHVLGGEVAHKSEHRIERRIRNSGLVERKTLEAFDWDFQPTLDKDFIIELARLDFVRRHDDVIITGKPGTGESQILKACGLRACEQRISVQFRGRFQAAAAQQRLVESSNLQPPDLSLARVEGYRSRDGCRQGRAQTDGGAKEQHRRLARREPQPRQYQAPSVLAPDRVALELGRWRRANRLDLQTEEM